MGGEGDLSTWPLEIQTSSSQLSLLPSSAPPPIFIFFKKLCKSSEMTARANFPQPQNNFKNQIYVGTMNFH